MLGAGEHRSGRIGYTEARSGAGNDADRPHQGMSFRRSRKLPCPQGTATGKVFLGRDTSYGWPVELPEEMSAADAVLLMSSVPERISDLVFGLDETRLRYRHGPAFPTLGGLIFHLLDSGTKVDGLLRHAHLDGLATADVRATIDPGHDEDLDRPLQEAIEDFARIRRRTVDLLHGWGKNEWERVITDPRGGSLTLLDVCRLVTRHEMAHVAQIRNLTVLLPEPQDLGLIKSEPNLPPPFRGEG